MLFLFLFSQITFCTLDTESSVSRNSIGILRPISNNTNSSCTYCKKNKSGLDNEIYPTLKYVRIGPYILLLLIIIVIAREKMMTDKEQKNNIYGLYGSSEKHGHYSFPTNSKFLKKKYFKNYTRPLETLQESAKEYEEYEENEENKELAKPTQNNKKSEIFVKSQESVESDDCYIKFLF
jgi:glutaredoxin